MSDRFVLMCPYCSGTETIEAYQDGYGCVSAVNNVWGGARIYHVICRDCGSVIRSYVKDPEKLLKKKDRK